MVDRRSSRQKLSSGHSPAAALGRFMAMQQLTRRGPRPTATALLNQQQLPQQQQQQQQPPRSTPTPLSFSAVQPLPPARLNHHPSPTPALKKRKGAGAVARPRNTKSPSPQLQQTHSDTTIPPAPRAHATQTVWTVPPQSYRGVPPLTKIPTLTSSPRPTLQEVEKAFTTPPRERAYDPLPPPSAENHRYVVTNRVLQNTALTRALQDPTLCRIQLVERDVDYLRALLPPQTPNRDNTRVDVDLIVDEKNGILFYPLREIGQSTAQDPDAGLNELLRTLVRIGPRYQNLWIIFEEYNWWSLTHTIRGVHAVSASSVPASALASTSPPSHTSTSALRIDPYAGPVMVQLRKLLAWIPTTSDKRSWISKISYHQPSLDNNEDDGDDNQTANQFHTRVLYASDERHAARMARAIGDRVVDEIEYSAKMGIRRDKDGWMDKDEWLWRDWLNKQDSTHERFLASFRVFNLFSIQIILSLCPLKEFLAMSHNERVQRVGKFIDVVILTKFHRMVTTPMN